MIAVDSSVWIDFFDGAAARPGVAHLRQLLDDGAATIVVPDLVLFEVLRGFRDERSRRQARRLLGSFDVATCGGPRLAVEAAEHWRALRSGGLTVRSPIDVLVATFCIDADLWLLHEDHDFDVFERERGLRVWRGMPASA